MARKAKDTYAINRKHKLFSDIYDECAKTEEERLFIDALITNFLLNDVFKGEEMTERAMAELFGISKSGVRVIFGRAQDKIKKALAKKGIKKTSDVIGDDSRRSAVAAKGGANSVDEKEKITEANGMKTVEFLVNFNQSAGPYSGFSSMFVNASSFAQAVKKLSVFIKEHKDTFDGTVASIIVHKALMPQQIADKLNIDGIDDEDGDVQQQAFDESNKLGKLFAIAGNFNVNDMLEASTDEDFCAARGAEGAWDIATEIEGEY